VAESKFLLDANTCIYLIEKLSPPVRQKAAMCQPGEMVTSAIVFAEVARGTDWNNAEVADLVTEFFDAVPVLAFDQHAARLYADLGFRRHRFDRLIAAHAVALNLTLVTANPRDFRDIPQLKLEDWTA
jgi:tRNA(fMet)-specific endonuclease VapC